MPWIPKRGALRRLREAAGYSIYDLALKVGISERQIRTIESETPPGSMMASTIQSLTKILKCEKEDLATWLERVSKTSATPADLDPLDESWAQTPIEELAEMERTARSNGGWIDLIETSEGPLELLGPARLIQIRTQYGALEGQPFLIFGSVDNYEPIGATDAEVFGVDASIAARFEISRALLTVYPFRITVLTLTADLTRHLLDAHQLQHGVDLMARVTIKRATEKSPGTVAADGPQPLPYALVVERTVTARYPGREDFEEPSS